ncbi:MAG: DUF397 domain-containing protein [Actinomycetota bacterium]|nr:DUF397 domain-containing protein [Actinomycetota bacterium]
MNHDQAVTELTATAGWRKSSYSQAANDCVELTTELPGWVGVRDSKLGTDSPLLAVTLSQWRAMLAATQAGELGT